MLSMCTCNIKQHLDMIVRDLVLNDYQKTILRQRYLNEVLLYDKKAKVAEFFYMFLSMFVTISSIILPALLSIQEIDYSDDEKKDEDFKKRVYWGAFIVSLLITISNGIIQFLSLHKQFVSFNQTKEQLLAEGWYYFELSGRYKEKTHESAFIEFCEQVEKIKKKQVDKELLFISDGDDKKADPVANKKPAPPANPNPANPPPANPPPANPTPAKPPTKPPAPPPKPLTKPLTKPVLNSASGPESATKSDNKKEKISVV